MDNKILEMLINIQKDIGGIKKDISTLKEDVNTLKQDMSNVKEDVNTLKQDMSNVKEDVNTLKQDMLNVKEDVNTLRKDMNDRFDVSDVNIDMLQKSIVLARVDIKNVDRKLTGQIATNMETIEVIKAKIQ